MTTDDDLTRATRAVAGTGIPHRVIRTERPSSVEESAVLQGIEVSELVRTIVVRRGEDDYLFLLIPGGRQIDWPKLRAHLGVKRLSLPDADEALETTGYERGAITPFGAKTPWPVIADEAVENLERVGIGGGARGVNLHLAARDLLDQTGAVVADIARPAD
jgi:Cys-tRNA(Pro) deacylase